MRTTGPPAQSPTAALAPTTELPQANLLDTVRIAGWVIAPMLARGVIVRRPPMTRLAEVVDADKRAVKLLQRMRIKYGHGPLRLRLPVRRMVVLLDPDHVHRVLAESPDPFTPATQEKVAALSHFQPHGVLISQGAERADRRRFNEEVLDSPHAVHRSADVMVGAISQELQDLLTTASTRHLLTWDEYATTYQRVVRRVVLGDGARDDVELTDQLTTLRATANWAFLHPQRTALRAQFLHRLEAHLERATPGSLAASWAHAPTTQATHPVEQVPQWMFAFDAGSWASYRALALLHAHPEGLARAQQEVAGRDLSTPQDLPFLRACILESLRLWPTTPALLRESTAPTVWDGATMPASTSILTYAPYFHRDELNLPEAHHFAPELWLSERTAKDWPLVPFSAGPAECAGRNFVLHVTSTILAHLVSGPQMRLEQPDRLDPRELPGSLDPFTLRFQVRATPARV
ncbi:cytochrome P450 [Actinotalea sp. K2]|uniref:cytochrome P450 n=1 Tax=Actinotalea sp. K2 TaxID=2939438 RepID=UPI0020173470|nr:cytochrome P450 [Actinotalea sp. K2]MCL3859702.1 cytochrome P450 [Actinotalea sp. K2]